jgi:hypothetical protein
MSMSLFGLFSEFFSVGGGTFPSGQRGALAVPKLAGSSPSGVKESTFRSDLLLTAGGSST